MIKLNKEQRGIICDRICKEVSEKCSKTTITEKEKKEVIKNMKSEDLDKIVKLQKALQIFEEYSSTINIIDKSLKDIYEDIRRSYENILYYKDIVQRIKNEIDHTIHNSAYEQGIIYNINTSILYGEVREILILSTIESTDLKNMINDITKELIKKYSKRENTQKK